MPLLFCEKPKIPYPLVAVPTTPGWGLAGPVDRPITPLLLVDSPRTPRLFVEVPSTPMLLSEVPPVPARLLRPGPKPLDTPKTPLLLVDAPATPVSLAEVPMTALRPTTRRSICCWSIHPGRRGCSSRYPARRC